MIVRGSGAGTTAIVGTPTVTQIAASSALSATSLAITADTTNGALAVTITGVSGPNVRWNVSWRRPRSGDAEQPLPGS